MAYSFAEVNKANTFNARRIIADLDDTNIRRSPINDFGNSLILATENVNIDAIKFILRDLRLSSSFIDTALIVATENGDLSIIPLFLNDIRTTSDGVDKALSSAVLSSNEDMVRMILTSPKITGTGFAWALKFATPKILPMILSDSRINQDMLILPLVRLAARGKLDMVEILLKYSKINGYAIDEAIAAAISNNQFAMVKLLFPYMRFEYSNFTELLNKTKNDDIVNLILTDPRLTPETVAGAIEYANRARYHTAINQLRRIQFD